MAQKQTSINVETVQDGTNNKGEVIIWSALRYPLTLTRPVHRYNGKTEKGAQHVTERAVLKPGGNRVSREMWDHSKTKDTIMKRLDLRELVVTGTTAKPREMEAKLEMINLGAPAQKMETISNLCPDACGVTMKDAMKRTGAPQGLADMDDESAQITLES